MQKHYNYLDIDLDSKNYRRLNAMQGDIKSRYILVNLYSNNLAYDLSSCTVKIYGLKRDKTIFFNNAVIKNEKLGQFEIELTNQALAVPGELKIQILVLGAAGEKLSSSAFVIDVGESIIDENAIESTNEFGALTESLTKVDEWDKYFEETSGKIEEKYTERLNSVDSQIKDKANLDEVRLKTSSIGINDLDEETKKAILENNNIDISYVLDDNSVTRDKLKNNEIYGEKVHFVKSKCQYVNYSEVVENKYYGHGNINTVTSENGCIYPPIKIFSGVTYYYKNLYAYFSNIKYNNGTLKALTDKTTGIVEGSFFAEDDGLLYCTVNKVYYDQGIFPMVANNEDFPHHYTYGDYETSIPTLKDVGVESTKFANKVYQYIDPLKLTHGRYYGRNNTNSTTGENVAILEPLSIKKGEHYYFKNIYAYFSCVEYSNGTIKALSDKTGGYVSGDFIAENDGTLYVTINTTYDYIGTEIALSNSKLGLMPSQIGYVGTEIIDIIIPNSEEVEDKTIKTTVITVKKDGSGDFIKITDAINSISDSNQFNQYEIHVYSKTYDLVEEFGGLEWVQSISHDNGEKQGLVLPDYVHLIGHGSVYVDCIVSDENATSDFAKSVSTINVWKNNRLEGITFRAKNTRYVIHDETGNGFSDLTRLIKNCRFIHLGTKSNLWSSPKAMGGGMGSGGRYDIINSHFESPFIPFSYHNNENQKSNYLNIDGCTFTGNKSAHQYDIGFGYYKKNTEKTYITVKNCISDRGLRVHQETSNIESDNVFEVIEINNIIRS